MTKRGKKKGPRKSQGPGKRKGSSPNRGSAAGSSSSPPSSSGRRSEASHAQANHAQANHAQVRPSGAKNSAAKNSEPRRFGRHGQAKFGSRHHDGQEISSEEDASPKAWLETAKQATREQIRIWLAAQETQKQEGLASPELRASHLDPWQQEVLSALMAGSSVVVDAPTTAGKTRAVERYFREHINDPLFRAAYTTPVKSLSNDKLREFRAMFGAENVGIATGDIKENLGAPIVVATLESYRNSLLGVEPDLGRNLVVFDEYHYLQDESRGSAWEEALILTPRTCQVLLLSASVDNAGEFNAWLSSLWPDRSCVLVRTEKRPVPLVDLIYKHGSWLLPETLPVEKEKKDRGGDRGGERGERERHRTRGDGSDTGAPPVRQEELGLRLAPLLELGLTPSIVYCGKRISCETMAALLCRNLPPLQQGDAELIGESLDTSQKEFRALTFISPKLRQMLQVYGVGFHHSGLAAPARMAIEALVKNGLLRFCTSTMGLSLGINFSVRSALIADYQRPGELGFTDYAPSEVLQMLGRAGRRGRDAVGFSLWASEDAYKRLGHAKRDRIESRLRSDPTTFLGLVGRGYGLRAIETFYSKSFRRFTDSEIDLSLWTPERLKRALQVGSIPCESPAAAYAGFIKQDTTSPCLQCPHLTACHRTLKAKKGRSLANLHLHLHQIGALRPDESLTEFGAIARYFPQAGGLVMAKLLADGEITAELLPKALELAATLTLARFKEPGADPRYRLPFGEARIEESLATFYPYQLFGEIYDPPYRSRSYPVIREFNPRAGFVLREWTQGLPWKELAQRVTHEQYGTGDMMSLIYRSATYLQSVIQADLRGLSEVARALREAILREPLSYALSIG